MFRFLFTNKTIFNILVFFTPFSLPIRPFYLHFLSTNHLHPCFCSLISFILVLLSAFFSSFLFSNQLSSPHSCSPIIVLVSFSPPIVFVFVAARVVVVVVVVCVYKHKAKKERKRDRDNKERKREKERKIHPFRPVCEVKKKNRQIYKQSKQRQTNLIHNQNIYSSVTSVFVYKI